jgi:hypothetical protein
MRFKLAKVVPFSLETAESRELILVSIKRMQKRIFEGCYALVSLNTHGLNAKATKCDYFFVLDFTHRLF